MARYSGPGTRRGGSSGRGGSRGGGAPKKGAAGKKRTLSDAAEETTRKDREKMKNRPTSILGEPAGKRARKEAESSDSSEPASREPQDVMLHEAKVLLSSTQGTVDQLQRTKVIDQVFALVRGRLRAVALKHDASRVIQALLKFGSPPQRNVVLDEIEPHIVELCKSKYSYHIVRKLLKYTDKARVIKALQGHIVELLRHQFGAVVIEDAYSDYANAIQRCAFIEEFYGAEFTAFHTDKKRTLAEILEETPAKRVAVLQRMNTTLSSLLNKPHVTDSSLFHAVIAQYFSVADDADVADMVPLLHEHLSHMVHTRDGVRVAIRAVELGNAKDRKAIIKSIKGHVPEAFKDQYAHLFIMALLDRTDDTTLLKNAILEPIMGELAEICMDKYASCPILNLLSPMNSQYFDPNTAKLFEYPSSSKPTCTSKKPAEQRRAELLAVLGPQLLTVCEEHTRDMMCSTPGSRILTETFFNVEGDKEPLAKAIAHSVALTDPSDDSRHGKAGLDDQPDEVDVGPAAHVLGHKVMQRLLNREKETTKDGKTLLWEAFFDELHTFGKVEQRLTAWAKHNRMAFVLVALVNNCPESRKEELRSFFAPVCKAVRASKATTACAGTTKLLEVLK